MLLEYLRGLVRTPVVLVRDRDMGLAVMHHNDFGPQAKGRQGVQQGWSPVISIDENQIRTGYAEFLNRRSVQTPSGFGGLVQNRDQLPTRPDFHDVQMKVGAVFLGLDERRGAGPAKTADFHDSFQPGQHGQSIENLDVRGVHVPDEFFILFQGKSIWTEIKTHAQLHEAKNRDRSEHFMSCREKVLDKYSADTVIEISREFQFECHDVRPLHTANTQQPARAVLPGTAYVPSLS